MTDDLKLKVLAYQSVVKHHNKTYLKMIALKRDIHDSCDRLCDHIQKEEVYVPGSYLDMGYTEYYEKCNVCGYYKSLGYKSSGMYG